MQRKVCLFVLVALLLAGQALAEDRALIIGIGQGYRSYGINPILGPERDVELMVPFAKAMGFSSIRTIREEAATRQAIIEGFEWVKQGVKPGEKAFIFYSGHGTQIPDPESAGCAQAIVPVDKRFIINHEIGRWLKGMERSKVIFIVDSCFSGTITKSFYRFSANNIKYYKATDSSCGQAVNLRGLGKGFGIVKDDDIQKNVVALSATANNEVAYGDLTGGNRGSLFTQSIFDTVNQTGLDITFRELRDRAADSIQQVCERMRPPAIPHHPQINGDPVLVSKNISLEGEATGYSGGSDDAGDAAQFFGRLVANSEFMVAIRVARTRYRLGESVSLSVASSVSGYINIIDVGPDGQASLLFPNEFKPDDNYVEADREVRIPEDIGGFKMQAQPPTGASKIVVLVSREPLNLYKEKMGKASGGFKEFAADSLASLKQSAQKANVRSFRPVEDKTGGRYGAAGISLEVAR